MFLKRAETKKSDTSSSQGGEEHLDDIPLDLATDVEKASVKAPSDSTNNRLILCTRISMLTFLLAAAAIVGSISYFYVKDNQAEYFEQQWSSNAQQVLTEASVNAENIFKSITILADVYPTISDETEVSLPFVTLQDFEDLALKTRRLSGISVISYIPYLNNEIMREKWEAYSDLEANWVDESYAFHPDDSYQGGPFSKQIWRHTKDGHQEVTPRNSAPYLPAWQTSPPPVDASKIVNFDYASAEVYYRLMRWVLQTGKPILSEPFDIQSILGVNTPQMQTNIAHSIYLQPVYSSLSNMNSQIVAFLSAAIPWDAYFGNILPTGQNGIYVVLNSCGSMTTFRLDGCVVSFVGEGDHHDPAYDNYVKSAAFAQVKGGDAAKMQLFCEHTLSVYPSNEMKSPQSNMNPAALCGIVVGTFCFAAILFVFYDFLVRRQQSPTVEQKKADAIINSLFPGDIGEQVIESGGLDKGQKDLAALSQSAIKHNALMKYVNGTAEKNEGKPMAELFPDATIMFADIAGFTAWSSIREPAHVFMLLETIFGAFDEIAVEQGVFKVETVGDCYVAVCGLPKHNDQHAMVMARFARDCMEKVGEVIRELELKLGPDTAELAMRFGLHSGQVTAGVLRGDRARFQLFGDTVNTAARIESTGQKNRIHLSEQTASLIMAAGHKNWVSEREDQVEAKGKGIMKTYWLLTLCSERETTSSNADSTEDNADNKSSTPKSSFMDRIKAIKETRASKEKRIQRLVQWNSEMLIQSLKQVVAHRQMLEKRKTSPSALNAVANNIGHGGMVVDEVSEIINMPEFDARACGGNANDVELSPQVLEQVHSYVGVIASMYRDNSFHNFEHASHVTMSVSKLLSRIVAPQLHLDANQADRQLHDHTYGITSDPLTQFSVVLAALIHDVDHRGVPNFVLNGEEAGLSTAYQNKSTAEQNSVDLAWRALLSDGYEQLRECIFADISELRRFRQLLVNSVIATDIFDKELASKRKDRWNKAFSEENQGNGRLNINRKATIVIEHLIQASDVAHTMQHWHVYTKWNERLFEEMYSAYRSGRMENDPSENWYQGEIGFLDNYVIPLAKKLKNCGVFGVSSDEYLNYATENRREWAARGQEIVANYLEKHVHKEYKPFQRLEVERTEV